MYSGNPSPVSVPPLSTSLQIPTVRIAMSLQSQRQHSVSQRALCILICLMSWDGPMPILHHHGAGHTEEWLTSHCRTWHSNRAECGFHWHLARLKDLDGRLPGHHNDESLRDSACSIVTQIESQRQFAFNLPMLWTPIETILAHRSRSSAGMLNAMTSVDCCCVRVSFRDTQSICARLGMWLSRAGL